MKTTTYLYLDHAATTPLHPEVMACMMPYFDGAYGNPSSMYEPGRRAKNALNESRERIASVLGCLPGEVIFTGSGTESDNLAILGTARANKKFGNHILISSVEHKAVLESARQLEREGFIVEYIPVDACGMIDVDDVLGRITDSTILISVMYANNEIGTVEPIKELAEALSHHKGRKQFPLLHTDACQAAGYLPLGVEGLKVDLMSMNGSKIYGPKGVGLLYRQKEVNLDPIIFGGEQEQGLRSGTENLPYIVGLSEALVRIESKRQNEADRVRKLREYLLEELQKIIPDMVLNGHREKRLPNNIHISIPYIEGESIVLLLDNAGIYVSTGSACSSNDLQVSHVLVAINQDEMLRHGSLRISLGETTSKEDCDYFIGELSRVVKRLRSMSPLTVSL